MKYGKSLGLNLETLERRLVLASSVVVRQINDDLIISGDHGDSTLFVEPFVAGKAGAAPGSLLITPDGETSINGMPQGESLKVTGATGQLRLNMRGGEDQVVIQGNKRDLFEMERVVGRLGGGDDTLEISGAKIADGVKIQGNNGDDLLSMRRVHLGGPLLLDGGKGVDVAKLSQTTSGEIDKATPILLNSLTRVENVEMNKAQFAGALSVDAAGDNGEIGTVKMSEVKLGAVGNKATPVLILNNADVDLLDVKVEGPVVINGGGSGKVNLQDVSITKELDKSSPLLLQISNSPDVKADKLTVDGKLEYLVLKLNKALVSSYSMSNSKLGDLSIVSNYNLSASGKISQIAEDVSINYGKVESHYVPLAPGKHNLSLERWKIGGDVSLAQSHGTTHFEIVSSKVDGKTSLRTPGVDPPQDADEAKLVIPTDANDNNVHIETSLLLNGLEVRTGGPTDLKISKSTAAAVDYYIKIEGVPGESQAQGESHVQVVGSKMGSLTVESENSPTHFHIEDSEVRESVSHSHKGEIDIDAWSWGARDSSIGTVKIESDGSPVKIKFEGSQAAAFAGFIKIGDIEGESKIEAEDTDIRGDFTVDSFFDIDYKIDLSGGVPVPAPQVSVSANKLNVGGDFVVDSFFDIEYQVGGNKQSSAGGPLEGAANRVHVENAKFGGDFHVDSFFDIEYQVDPTGGDSGPTPAPASDVVLKGSHIKENFQVDSFFDIFYHIPPNSGDAPPENSVRVENSGIGGNAAANSSFKIVYHKIEWSAEGSGRTVFSDPSNKVEFNKANIGGDFQVDSFFDIEYEIDVEGTGSPDMFSGPRNDVQLADSKFGGNFQVDSFFDIDYKIDLPRTGVDNPVVAGPTNNVDGVRLTIKGSDFGDELAGLDGRDDNSNFHVDSFFDITYQLDSPHAAAPAANKVSFSESQFEGDFHADSFFDIWVEVSPNGGGVPEVPAPHNAVELVNSQVGRNYGADSFFDIFYAVDVPRGIPASRLQVNLPDFHPLSHSLMDGTKVGGDAHISHLYVVNGEADLPGDRRGSGGRNGRTTRDEVGPEFRGDVAPMFMTQVLQSGVGGNLHADSFFDIFVDAGEDRWSQVLVEQSQIGGQLAVSHGLNQPHPNRSAAATHVEVSQTRLGALTIESKGDLADHVALNKVGIQNRAIVRLGGGDDHAEVKDSVFAGASLFDGGSEVDMLLLIGNAFASEPILENWETVTRNDAAP